MILKLIIACLIFSGLAPAAAAQENLAARAEVAAFIQDMAARHDYDAARLNAIFAAARISDSVLEAISRPAEALPWHRYRDIFIQPGRIRQGAAFWREHERQLERAAKAYGVPVEIMVAIIGIETKYGRNTGGHKVIDALATLAFNYPKRAGFFTDELEHYLLLTREQSLDPHALKGSYAGAMGIPQFISSSYRNYAVDFDEDGRIDIWENPADAIGSVGNYLQQHGWRAGEPITTPARVDGEDVSALLTPGLELKRTMAELARGGVSAWEPVDAATMVNLLQLENQDGYEYWLALHNFYVITRYNRSALYAMAVWRLADAISRKRQARR